MVESFTGAMALNPAQVPRIIADVIVALIDTPTGERPFRTVIDNMGMAGAVVPHNEGSKQVYVSIDGAFCMGDMATANVGKSCILFDLT